MTPPNPKIPTVTNNGRTFIKGDTRNGKTELSRGGIHYQIPADQIRQDRGSEFVPDVIKIVKE